MIYKISSSIFALTFSMSMTNVAVAQDHNGSDDSAYCDKVRARAHSDAWLLFSPSIQLQAVRYPAIGDATAVVGGSTDRNGDQLRGYLSWSPLDVYRGTKMLTAADKDCLAHAAANDANNLLEQMNDVGRASALQAEVNYLNANMIQTKYLLAKIQQRLSIGNITIIDVATIQQSITILDRKLAISQGQLDILLAKDYVKNPQSSIIIANKLQSSTMEFEKEGSKLRMLDPFTFQIIGGVVPPMTNADSASVYGMITIGYNFGGIPRGNYEDKYLAARQSELQHARYELADEMRRLQDGIRAGISSTTLEISSLDQRIVDLKLMKDNLINHPDAPNGISAQALIDLQIMDAESDRVFLVELRNQLQQWK